MGDKEITNAEIPGCPPGEVRGRRRTMRLLAVTGVTMFILLVIVILLGIRARERAESDHRSSLASSASLTASADF